MVSMVIPYRRRACVCMCQVYVHKWVQMFMCLCTGVHTLASERERGGAAVGMHSGARGVDHPGTHYYHPPQDTQTNTRARAVHAPHGPRQSSHIRTHRLDVDLDLVLEVADVEARGRRQLLRLGDVLCGGVEKSRR